MGVFALRTFWEMIQLEYFDWLLKVRCDEEREREERETADSVCVRSRL